MASLFEKLSRQDRTERFNQAPTNEPGKNFTRSNTARQAGGMFGDAIAAAGGHKDPKIEFQEQVQLKMRELKGKGMSPSDPNFFKELSSTFFTHGMFKEGQELVAQGFKLENELAQTQNVDAQTSRVPSEIGVNDAQAELLSSRAGLTEAQAAAVPVELLQNQQKLNQAAVALVQGFEELQIKKQQANTAEDRNALIAEETKMRKTVATTQANAQMFGANARMYASLATNNLKPKNSTGADVTEMEEILKKGIGADIFRGGLELEGGDGLEKENDIEAKELALMAKGASDRAKLYEAQGYEASVAKTKAAGEFIKALELSAGVLFFNDSLRFNPSAVGAPEGTPGSVPQTVNFNDLP